MYKFTDTTEVSEALALPSEALQINGEFIENTIKGYRTLSVSGRESLPAELSYFETGVRDGSKLRSKRYPARVITIAYQLIADSNEEFREAFNQLAKILNVEDAELIFNDELDKFFIGTPETIGEVPSGRNAVIGEFEILCMNPFKYSTTEYQATANLTDRTVTIDYNGTYKSYPILQAEFYDEAEDGENETQLTGNGDCGFVAFFNEHEKIIQLGEPTEVDGEPVPASQTLMNQTFKKSTSWGTNSKKLWAVNVGSLISSTVQQIGTIAMKSVGGNYFLGASNYGTSSGWHGTSITRQFKADAAGDVGAKNFDLQSKISLGIGNSKNSTSEQGAFQVQITDADENNIAGFRIAKTKSGNKATLYFYVNGVQVKKESIDIPYKNRIKSFYIRRNGSQVKFKFHSKISTFTDEALEGVPATQVTYSFEQYGSKKALSYNGVTEVKLIKNNCDTWSDIPNKFSANDILEAHCESGEIYLNEIASPELGALGNDWEEFYLKPGLNQLGFGFSDWVSDEYAPTIKVRYREVFL